MNDKQMATLKKNGMERALLEKASSAIWAAAKCCERSPKDNFKNFREYIAEARKLIDEAEQCWKETYQL